MGERTANWYFDFISPFAYLQWQRLKVLSSQDEQACTIAYRPLLLAALLNHHGQMGPAEIPAKRLFTYRHVQWRAQRAGVALRFPPRHPFNPLAALRLCVAAGSTPAAIDAVFAHIWRDGQPADTPEGIAALAARLGLDDPEAATADAAVKAVLAGNFASALQDQVFGVPTLAIEGQLFWGEDATDMFLGYLAQPGLFDSDAMQHLAQLPVGAQRRQAR